MATGRQFQDPTSGTAGMPPETVNPAATRVLGRDYPVSQDVPTYDSGPVLLTTSFVAYGPSVLSVTRSFLGHAVRFWRVDSSQTTVVQIDLTDGDDVPLMPTVVDLGPKGMLTVVLHSALCSNGVKMKCSALNSVRAQVNGYQVTETNLDGTLYTLGT